jgi:hypothetical protein
VDEGQCSAREARLADHPEIPVGDPLIAATRSMGVAIIADALTSEVCERCGAVGHLGADDGVKLCEGCAL